jgi:hypothetical protein
VIVGVRALLLAFAVLSAARSAQADTPTYPWLKSAPSGRTVAASIPVPAGHSRESCAPGSFCEWLRGLPLKPAGSPVTLFDGRLKANQEAHHAVVDLDVGRENLQQCADAAIRLRAEYLWSRGLGDRIGFHFTSGTWVPWSKWTEGWRPVVRGSSVGWARPAAPDKGRATFLAYLRTIFLYAGTASLAAELGKGAVRDLRAGDVLVHGGHPGHAVLVLDTAADAAGRRVLLVGQSYMPAQEFHVLKNAGDPGLSPWYRVSDLERGLVTPEWPLPFGEGDIRRFDPIAPKAGK